MTKCADCSLPYEPTQKARYKCSAKLCQIWTHKQCSDKRQFNKEGYWFCKIHIEDIPLESRRSNVKDGEESNKDDDEKKVTQLFWMMKKVSPLKMMITNPIFLLIHPMINSVV